MWDARSTRCVNKLYAAHGFDLSITFTVVTNFMISKCVFRGFDVCSVSLSKQKQHMLLSGGSDGKARLWDLRSGQEVA